LRKAPRHEVDGDVTPVVILDFYPDPAPVDGAEIGVTLMARREESTTRQAD
jgi:hypothetical protein